MKSFRKILQMFSGNFIFSGYFYKYFPEGFIFSETFSGNICKCIPETFVISGNFFRKHLQMFFLKTYFSGSICKNSGKYYCFRKGFWKIWMLLEIFIFSGNFYKCFPETFCFPCNSLPTNFRDSYLSTNPISTSQDLKKVKELLKETKILENTIYTLRMQL